MSTPRGNGQNGGHFYSNITQPVKIDMNFVVDSSNGNGLGIRSLKSNGYVNKVFMHTSATPAAGNPNPAAGFMLIQLKNNYNHFLGANIGCVSPLSGSGLTSVTSGNAYVITSLGTASLAQWQAKGLPAGVTPAVGVSFVASASGSIGGSAQVQAPSKSGVQVFEVVGDANLSMNSSTAQNGGAWILIQCLAATDSSTTTLIPKAPADGSVIGVSLYMNASSNTIDGL